MCEVVIVSGVRTAVGTFGGSLKSISPVMMGAQVIEETLKRGRVDPSSVDEVIMGHVLQAGLGQNTARQASMKAGIPHHVPAMTVNQVCGSGMKAVHLACMAIMTNQSQFVVAGGMESMSSSPYLLPHNRWGKRMGDGSVIDSMVKDGLWCAFHDIHMGMTAENIAAQYSITREEQDEYAALSQNRAEEAQREDRFQEEILPLSIPQRKKDPLIFKKDEHPRQGVTKEGLAKLPPAFKKDGTVTAGNASGINDGAAALLLTSKEVATREGLPILATIVDMEAVGVDPAIMGIGPIPATRKILTRQNLGVKDLHLIEANEAFAVQSIAVKRDLDLPLEKLNVNGGAIALGHPIGASGARILITLLYALKGRGGGRGIATLCVGGGQGLATLIES